MGRHRSRSRPHGQREIGEENLQQDATVTSPNDRPTNPELQRIWLPLLRTLTAKYPSWGVWKNPESAFIGPGDIDSLAPPQQWDDIEETFRDWATDNGFSPIVVCRHVPQGPHFVTVAPDWPHMLILDVKELSTWRGSTLIDYKDLANVAIVEERGFRRVRPGAEGVVKLVLNGVLIGGRMNEEGLRTKGVRDLLSGDREGVAMVAEWFGPLKGVVLDGVDAVIAGGWDRRAMATLELFSTARSVLEPRTAASRLWFKHYGVKKCGVLQSVRGEHRAIAGDTEEWARRIAVNHEVDLQPGVRP